MRTHDPRVNRAILALAVGLAAVLVSATSVLATATFDPATGTGLVDKADVEATYGWNDHQFQANARKVSFHAERLGSWSWDCPGDGGSGLTADSDATSDVGSTALGTAVGKRLTAITGFSLNGPGLGTASTTPATCGSGDPANVSSSFTDLLWADFRGDSRVVWSS
jgi:hypothetical protein